MLTNPAILDRLVDSGRGFPPEVARQVLKLGFSTRDRERYKKLAYKAQEGNLTKKERAELEDYINVNDLLMILRAKAESSLRKKSPAA